MIELGRVNILYETNILATYIISPSLGHLNQLIHVFAYLKKHSRSTLIMEPTHIDITWTGNLTIRIKEKRLRTIYRDATEDLPTKSPEPRGKEVQMNVFIDLDHAGDRVSRKSHTGILIFANMAPIAWFSKKQNSIEPSTFGSEYVSLRIGIEKS